MERIKTATLVWGGKTYEVPYYDCSYSKKAPLWLFKNEFGCTAIIKADSFEDAFDELLDNSNPISDDDMEEYALDSNGDLNCGYYYQPNFTPNTCGIINLGYYWTYEKFPNNRK